MFILGQNTAILHLVPGDDMSIVSLQVSILDSGQITGGVTDECLETNNQFPKGEEEGVRRVTRKNGSCHCKSRHTLHEDMYT